MKKRPLSILPAEDGITHYNVRYQSAKTELGLKLAIDFPADFEHPILGPFQSIEAFWRYVTTFGVSDKIRQLSAENQPSRKLRQVIQRNTYSVPNFYDYIEDALLVRLGQDEALRKQLVEDSGELPLVHYSIFAGEAGEIAIQETPMHFYVLKLETVRKILRGQAQPSVVDYETFLSAARDAG